MKRTLSVGVGLVALLSFGTPRTVDAGDNEFQLAGYAFVLPNGWVVVEGGTAKPGVVAIRNAEDPVGQQIGEILAATLKGPMDKEMREMVDSANGSKGRIKVVSSGDFVTDSSVTGRVLSLTINASDPKYGSPLLFHSVYLPNNDGISSITIKLRCAESKRDQLVPEFESIIRASRQTTK